MLISSRLAQPLPLSQAGAVGTLSGHKLSGRINKMLWTILVVLLVLWLLGLVGGIGGSLIHILLVVALVVLVINLLSGRRTV